MGTIRWRTKRPRARVILRSLAIIAALGGLLAATHPTLAARPGVDGDTFTGVNFDWSVTWDEDDWALDAQNTDDGEDILMLENAGGAWALVTFLTDGHKTDADECASGWLRTMAGVQGVTDFERDDTLDTPRLPDDAAGNAYTYTQDDIAVAAYVECRVFPGDDAVLAMVLSADPDAYDEKIALFGDLLDTLTMGGDAASDTETDDGAGTTVAGSGIDLDAESYVSPTYGFELGWSGTGFDAITEEEEVNALPDDLALDRLLLFQPGAKLYIEGRNDYDGDAARCIETESDILAFHDGVSEFEPVENERGFPEAGETGAGGEYATYRLTQEQDGETITRIAYVECRTLVEGEAVMVISLYAREASYDAGWEAATAVIDSIVL